MVVFWSDYAIFQGITIDIINSQYVLKRVHKYGHKLHNVFSQAATVTKSAVGIPNNLLYLQKVFESQQFKKKKEIDFIHVPLRTFSPAICKQCLRVKR